MTFVAGLAIYRLGRALGLGAVAASVVFVLYEWSLPFSTDALLMPDALYGGLATFLLADDAGAMARGAAARDRRRGGLRCRPARNGHAAVTEAIRLR